MKTIRLQTAIGLCGCLGVMGSGSAFAQIISSNITYSVLQNVPDNNPTGLAITETFSAPISQITDLQVTLNIAGGFNGDFYAYITHGTGFSVLLNRVGRDTGNTIGYGDSGLNVTLSDASPNNIHTYQLTLNPGGGALTGTWAPDGRTDSPAIVTTASADTADLSSFNGIDPNGDWTLFVADLDPGDTGTVESFGMDVTGVATPEPTTYGLLALGGAALFAFRRFAKRNSPKSAA